ncbi:MAG: hypothetical protein AB4290_25880 [Spirulina sp.]
MCHSEFNEFRLFYLQGLWGHLPLHGNAIVLLWERVGTFLNVSDRDRRAIGAVWGEATARTRGEAQNRTQNIKRYYKSC